MSDKKTSIENAVERLTANYRREELFLTRAEDICQSVQQLLIL